MESEIVANYNLNSMPAKLDYDILNNNIRQDDLDEVMEGFDDVDKQKVMNRLDKFSCREEMERFVQNRAR